MYKVSFFDNDTHIQHTETYGKLYCAISFARELLQYDKFRIVQIWDVYKNKQIDLPTT